MEIRAALVGLGAIGSAHVLILSNLDAYGDLPTCDPERFERPNIGTYSYGTSTLADKRAYKVDIANGLLTNFNTHPIYGTAIDLIEAVNAGQIAHPPIVLSGLDSAEARYETQRLYPDHLIDGSTGDTSVTLHHARHGAACVHCLVPPIISNLTAAEKQSKATGIPVELLNDGDMEFTDEHLAAARPEMRERLQPFVGKRVCSVPTASELSNTDSAGYDPAAPFVAQMAACLDVGRLVAINFGMPTDHNFVQMDPLLGPQLIDRQHRGQQQGCVCIKRASVIERVRKEWQRKA